MIQLLWNIVYELIHKEKMVNPSIKKANLETVEKGKKTI